MRVGKKALPEYDTALFQTKVPKIDQVCVSMLLAEHSGGPRAGIVHVCQESRTPLGVRITSISSIHYVLPRKDLTLTLRHVSSDGTFNYMGKSKKQRILIRNMSSEDLYPIFLIAESPNLYNLWDEHLVLPSYLSENPGLKAVATVDSPP